MQISLPPELWRVIKQESDEKKQSVQRTIKDSLYKFYKLDEQKQ